MKTIFRTAFFAIAVSLTVAACGSKSQSGGESDASTETNKGDTAVVMDNDSLSNPPTVVDSLHK